MITPSPSGPVLAGLVVTRELARSRAAYVDGLRLKVRSETRLPRSRAAALGRPQLAGARLLCLGSGGGGDAWLEVVEDRDAVPAPAFLSPGWMALEICVADVDALARELDTAHFALAGGPVDLAVGDTVRAMQVVGPAGEVLYLTEVRGPLPPFSLPRAAHPVDRLFIPVLAATALERSVAWLESICGGTALRFRTRLGALNRAHGIGEGEEHDVAVLQLAGESLFELDQLPGRPAQRPARSLGIASITLAATAGQGAELARRRGLSRVDGRIVAVGPDGEVLEFMAPSASR